MSSNDCMTNIKVAYNIKIDFLGKLYLNSINGEIFSKSGIFILNSLIPLIISDRYVILRSTERKPTNSLTST